MSTENNFVQSSIPRFDGHYDHWSMLMENFLRSKEYWIVVQSGVQEPPQATAQTESQKADLEARRLKDLKAKNYLFQAIDRSILETILCKDTSKDIWDSMKKKYQGIGILSTSYALSSGGWLSLLLLVTVAGSTYFTSILIKRCMEADSTVKTYTDMGERAFGSIGKRIIYVVMYTELYLIVTGFLILEGDNLHNLFPEMQFKAHGLKLEGREVFVMIVALIVLPSVWLDNLSILAYISATGVIASVVIVVSVLWVGAFDGIGFHHKGDLVNWSGLPTALSLYGFCYCAHPVFPTIYNTMKKRHHFTQILLLCFLSATISYTSMAIIGYLMFGNKVDSQITLNLPLQKVGSKTAIYTTLVNPLSKYALMLEPVSSATENWFPKYKKKRLLRIIIRTILVATQVIVALAVPFFGYLMSLVGALLSMALSITIPCLCYLKIAGAHSRIELALISGSLLLSFITTVYGTYTSLAQIIHGERY